MTVLYLCDGKGCDRRDEFCMNECRHTSDKTHALNGLCAEPEKDARFVEVDPGVYAERDEELMAFLARRENERANGHAKAPAHACESLQRGNNPWR